MTPWNAAAAPALAAIVPDLRLVYTVRDGRDVACSLVRLPWGPSSMEEGLAYWAKRLRLAEQGIAGVPADRVLVVALERLVLTDRDAVFAELLRFVGIDDEPAMREFFSAEITPAKAHLGRWLHELAPDQARAVSLDYAQRLEELADEGMRYLPPLSPLPPGCVGWPSTAERSRVDPWADGRAAGA